MKALHKLTLAAIFTAIETKSMINSDTESNSSSSFVSTSGLQNHELVSIQQQTITNNNNTNATDTSSASQAANIISNDKKIDIIINSPVPVLQGNKKQEEYLVRITNNITENNFSVSFNQTANANDDQIAQHSASTEEPEIVKIIMQAYYSNKTSAHSFNSPKKNNTWGFNTTQDAQYLTVQFNFSFFEVNLAYKKQEIMHGNTMIKSVNPKINIKINENIESIHFLHLIKPFIDNTLLPFVKPIIEETRSSQKAQKVEFEKITENLNSGKFTEVLIKKMLGM